FTVQDCNIIDIPTFTDERGAISVMDKELPFQVRRVFWLHHIADGKDRGEHALLDSTEIIVAVHGSFVVDLVMSLGGFPLKKEGSQGQCKTFVVALKFAQFDFLRRTGRKTTPILLLDDIFDKLDARRVEQIVKLVASDEFGQTFITDTNKDNLDAILSSMNGEYKLFDVSAGEIKERHV
ncbi:MAG: WxcM-like domain-containing protein, partial [Bacteroidaceae bacterium]|nr:WxcM-like domain-containing protein [Bacteroidaceae bacterium]